MPQESTTVTNEQPRASVSSNSPELLPPSRDVRVSLAPLDSESASGSTEFDRFEALTKRLLAVPKDAISAAPSNESARRSA